ncbi:hypothetical protein Noda2021_00070 [Candidatus Dependentiae bacterium Noda2021]|nr:hypothetical protein Noda2021_00070 [Candidatus Dependentiae bacterium Noda2021]
MLAIVSPTHTAHIEIDWIELNTPVGNFVIEQGHIPTIVTLVPHAPCIYMTTAGTQEIIKPQSAIAEISRSEVTIFMAQ